MGPIALAQAIDFHLQIDRTLIITGQPGCGKSHIVKQAADRYGLPLVTMNLVMSESTDFCGLPFTLTLPDGKRITEWAAQKRFLTKKPYVLFLDEFFQGMVATMNAAAPILLEKRVGDTYLPDECRILVASNNAADKAGTNRVPSHIPNRGTVVNLEVSVDEWLIYAIEEDVPEVIPSYIMFEPEALTGGGFDPNRMINATPRQWMAVAHMMQNGLPDRIKFDCIAGRVGADYAAKFIAFEKIMGQVPTLEQIILDPMGTPVPSEPSAQYAIVGMLVQNVLVSTFDPCMKYVDRMPPDLQVVYVKRSMQKCMAVTATKEYGRWAVKFAHLLK